MKLVWIAAGLLILILVVLLLLSFKFNDIETPEYQLVKKYDEVEIRRYPKMIVAKTALSDNSFSNSGNQGFRTIAGYIFGGNEANQKIAMTAPVVMNMGDSASMYFVMPKKYSKDQLPKPSSSDVRIVEEAEKTLAVITYGGYSNDNKIKTHCKELERVLKQNNLTTKGSFMYMGYNAPWDAINRRNEVAIEVVLE